ncbi:MAG: LemA family protein, partial [Oscillospiraceae bacterium]
MIYIAIALIVLIALWAVMTYNSLTKLRVSVQEAFATMDVYLKKRFDLIPNLVETVKGYASHEKETLDAVISARNGYAAATNHQEAIEGSNQISKALGRLFALSESYPDLKANQNFISLQNDLNAIENDIANSRKYYNAVVKGYNSKTL